MPGPGHGKSKAKAKSKSTNKATPSASVLNATPDAYVGDIDNAQGWDVIVNILCDFFEIPDLTTRSGLKKVHANFETISRRLDKAYQKEQGNEKIAGGIVGIYAKMCVDSILRNKLFERGLLSKLIPLLDIASTRHLALRALGTVTHHGGVPIRVDIAKQSSVLVRLLNEFPDDPKVCELAITTLSHSVAAVLNTPPDQSALKSIDLPAVFKAAADNVKKPTASTYLINHAMDLLAMSTLEAPEAFKRTLPAVKFLVAGLRSKDWVFRCTCLGGIIRLHRHEAEPDQRMLDPMKFIAAIQRGFPNHISDVLVGYGPYRCETYLTLQATRDYQSAMMKCAQDHDLYKLAVVLAELILRTEFSIADGGFQSENPVTGRLEIIDVGLPFKSWADALPHCAKALRAKGNPKDADAADILDIKYSIMKQHIPDAVTLAKKALKRNPECAYFHYAITLAANNVDGLRAAKKGLKCKQTSPFVRFQLMQRAVEHAGDMGIRLLQDSPSAGDSKWEEGIAFLTSALEDSKTYVEQAPPDNRHMKNVLYWHILLTVTIRETEMAPDLLELQGAIKKLKLADEISTFVGVPPPKTNLRLAQETVVKWYPAAVKEFEGAVSKAGADVHDTITPGKVEDDLAAWLDDLRTDDGEEEAKPHCSHPKVNTNHVKLYRCSYCGNPSAVLRKCSGCSKTRYCDGECQKGHWSDHKKSCHPAPA